jgi:6-pyruvoyltetrahydropterin/6-carboxytetrahydropterin synthase
LHGHNYVSIFEAIAPELDAIGRVIDFGEFKKRLASWIEDNWDHGFLLHHEDKEAREAVSRINGQKLYLMDVNPTAENLAEYLLRVVAPQQLEGTGVKIVKVVLWETENCCAEASL